MATIRSFKGIRPAPGYAEQVAAPPYDVLSSAEARERAREHSFLHVTKAEIDLPVDINVYDDTVYAKARANLDKMISDGILKMDEKPCLYIYKLEWNGRTQTGLVACTSVDEYMSGIIKRHELTLEAKEQDRIRHIEATDANTGPIFLAYRSSLEVKAILKGWMVANTPACDFMADDGVKHTVWVIDDASTISSLAGCFSNIPYLYIADGHHRNASTAKVCQRRRQADSNPNPDAEYNYYLSVIFPDDELYIMDYNRIVKDLNGHTIEGFLCAIKDSFVVTKIAADEARPDKLHSFGMYMDGCWYRLESKDSIIPDGPVESLDVSILQNTVLSPILGIGDPRTDKRIDFVGGRRGTGELSKRVDSGEMAVAFAMYPTSMQELMRIADASEIMPPKSTWFEPKLRSGLIIHKLS